MNRSAPTGWMRFWKAARANRCASKLSVFCRKLWTVTGPASQITEFNLVDVNVPAQVREAYSRCDPGPRGPGAIYREEAHVHVNSVVPEARGRAARIMQEAEGYKAATVALAQGEANRFTLLLDEYHKAPQITRKRLYLQTMESVFSRTNKVLMGG